MSMRQIDQTKMIQFITLASAFGKRALDRCKIADDMEKKAAAVRPGVLQTLLTTGVITSEQQKSASDALNDPARTLQLLQTAAIKLAEFQKAGSVTKVAGDRMGRGESAEKTGLDESTPEYNSLTNPFVGQRGGNQKKASDHALFAGLGISQSE